MTRVVVIQHLEAEGPAHIGPRPADASPGGGLETGPSEELVDCEPQDV